MNLRDEQLDRYARHIILKEIGGGGQKRLLDAHALIVGAGGIGSPVIQYLAAAGVGKLTVVDDEVVGRRFGQGDRDVVAQRGEARDRS